MDTAFIDDMALEYEVSGTGEPVFFIHGALIADSFRPLLTEPVLAHRYKLITYHRRGYMGSSRITVPVSIAQMAADCGALLHYLGVHRAHIVGESLGGCIAIQLALDYPNIVHSLALLEPALIVGSNGPAYRDSLLQGQQRFRKGPAEQVVDEFLQARSGEDYRSYLDQKIPGAFKQAVADAATPFEMELPGLLDWSFDEEKALRITQPTLAVLGGGSNALWPRFGETHRMLLDWLPHVQGFILPDATHFLHIQNPGGMAKALVDFFVHHPIRPPQVALST